MEPTTAVTTNPLPALAAGPQPVYGLDTFLQQADMLSWIVLAILLVMSIVSWEVMLHRGFLIWRLRRRATRALSRFWSADGLAKALTDLSQEERGPFTRLAERGATAIQHHRRHCADQSKTNISAEEFLTRTLRQGIAEEQAKLETGLSVLASVGATAPFVGLFGTVWGIHHALVRIGMTGQATIDQVAGPVGEALIMTAIGLGVAIPAVLGYNALVRSNRRLLGMLNGFAHDYFTWLVTGARPPQPGAQARISVETLKTTEAAA